MEQRRWTAPQLGGGRRRSEPADSLAQALARTPLNVRRIMAAAVAAERAAQEGQQRKAVELLDAKVGRARVAGKERNCGLRIVSLHIADGIRLGLTTL